MDFNKELENLVKANISAIYIQSFEWQRFQVKIRKVAENQNKRLFYFNIIDNLKELDLKEKEFSSIDDKDTIADIFENIEENAIYIFEEKHEDFTMGDKGDILRYKFALREFKKKKSTLIMFSSVLEIPKELEKELMILDMPLPTLNDFEKLFNKLAKEFNISASIDIGILKSLLGLTIEEATNAISKAIAQKGKLTTNEIGILISQKEQIIKKSGHLEYFHPKDSMDSIGGLDNLKDWLKIRYKAFSQNAKKYKLKSPKGIMLLGIPGTGKSLSAKAVSSSWKMPLLRLDFGKIFGGIVGESESNIRETIKIAESLSPCVLWIDEIEKGLSGLKGGGDSGTSARVFGTFLTWMQEKTSEVFVLATANDISALPKELLRKGRFDEIFFVDLPTNEERKQIIKIHLNNVEQEEKNLNIEKLAEISKGFSGAELEEVVNEALFNIFSIDSKDKPILKTKDLIDVIGGFYPLSRTLKIEDLEKMREVAKARYKPASKYSPEKLESSDKTPKFKQEQYDDTFEEDDSVEQNDITDEDK
ncbi:MAG: AAA family ATPase [Epsilonproteobacteria bacterium]|nr:MAG: AAA family ATPase [Campylobacterota bacterium]